MKLFLVSLLTLTMHTQLCCQLIFFTRINYPSAIPNNIEFGVNQDTRQLYNYRIQHKIKEQKITFINKKGKGSKNQVLEKYNKMGRVIYQKSKYYQVENQYLYDTLTIQSKQIIKNDTTLITYEYDQWNKLKISKTYKNGQIQNELLITKNSSGIITNRLNKYGKKLKHSSEMKYYLDTENKLIKSERYLDNELKNVWNYECKPEGELVKNKNFTEKSICKWNETSSDGGYIIFYRTTEYDRTYLNKSYYTKDSIYYKSEKFQNDTLLIQSYELNDFSKISKRYNLKNQKTSETIEILNKNKQTSSYYSIRYFKKKVHISEQIHTYNAQNLLISDIHYYNTKKNFESHYEYSYFE
ncbi:MAG: hypothetical protein HYR91_09395 [Flavobacteriia bacterium]|nr:hypothetical protein [Flavobacteriia bacterium]